MWLATTFPSNSATFRLYLTPSPALSFSLSLSPSRATAGKTGTGLIHPSWVPREERNEEDENERTERKRSRTVDRGRAKGEWDRGGSSAEWNPFRNCKPPCSIPFLHRLADTLPRPFPGSFPQEKPLPLLDSHRPSRSLSPRLAPFRETACLPRILISSKVLFPLNRAATRNNALYVRVLRLSLPPSVRRSTFPLTLSGHSTFLRVSPVSAFRLSSCRQARNLSEFVPKQFYIFN